MITLWNRLIAWFIKPQRETMEYIYELGKIAGRCEAYSEYFREKANRNEM